MNIYQQKILSTAMVLISVTAICSACGSTPKAELHSASTVIPREVHSSNYIEKSFVTDTKGNTWIPLEPALASLGYRMKDETSNGGYAKIGYSDVMYMLRPGSSQVFSLGEQFNLPDPPKRNNGQIYMTTTSLSKFLQTEVGWNPRSGEIEIGIPSEPENTASANQKNSPAGNPQSLQAKPFRIQSASVDTGELVSFAKRFLGVPYEFGAGPYEESKTFDCSSFTRYVYKRFGVNLPRLAKDQDNLGSRVKRSELSQGDLIFFTVPGRFESDAIPGHVGIYIGGGQFIHTWGDPGVQISDLDSGYWSNVILHMQHIL